MNFGLLTIGAFHDNHNKAAIQSFLNVMMMCDTHYETVDITDTLIRESFNG